MQKEWKQLKCSVCGGDLEEHGNKLSCRYCRTIYECVERISEAEVIQLNQATVKRTRLLFDDALEEYELILKEHPENSEAAWGAFLSFYGILYERDYDGKYVPTCHRLNECPAERNPYYSLLSPSAKERAQEIESLRTRIFAQTKTIPQYDVFICYKATDDWNGRSVPTKEAQWARDTYDLLTRELGLKVFFAEKCLSNTNVDYEPHIYSALQSAKLMFILTNSLDHLNAVWVQNEWRRYAKYIRDGKDKTIRVIYDEIEPYDLPRDLQRKQAINHNALSWVQDIKRAANEIFHPEPVVSAQEELNRLRKQIEELQKAQAQKTIQPTQTERVVPTPPTPQPTVTTTPEPQKSAEELFNVGMRYYNQKDYKNAVIYFEKAAKLGHVVAQNNLGLCYKNGYGVTRNYQKAVEWYTQAANQGNASAQNNLGLCYKNGWGVRQNSQKEIKWFTKAANQGHAIAQYNLGRCYENGYGVIENHMKAVKWYTKAATQGNVDAQNALGIYYSNRPGIAQNSQKAVEWYTKAANQGFANAQYNLGVCYHNGFGVPKNIQKAKEWYTKAANQGFDLAKSNLNALNNASHNSLDKKFEHFKKFFK